MSQDPQFPRLVLIGGDTDAFNRFLETDDPCFGRFYSASSGECKDCVAPVLENGQVFLLKEVCRTRTAVGKGGRAPTGTARINRLPSRDVMDRLSAGKSATDIFLEILGAADIDFLGREARQYLYDSFYYLRESHGVVTPDLPKLKELKTAYAHRQGNSDRRGAPGSNPHQ